jgi:exodeoxyribonuclease-5
MVAAMPGEAGGEVAPLLGMLRLAVPDACSTASGGFVAYRRKGKWQAALRGRCSQEEVERTNTRATELYDTCRVAYADLRTAAAGGLLALLAPDLRAIVERFQAAKRAAAQLDFDDLLYGARDLLAANPAVRAALARRFRHVLVDEFQDTDPLQTEILWRLCGDPPDGQEDAPWPAWRLRDGALFMVGDPKQAIYRFRGADVGTYVKAREVLLATAPGNVLPIGRNFRSVAPILEWVNERFATPLGAAGQPGFAPLFSTLAPLAGCASVLALDVATEDTSANGLRDAEAEQVAEACLRLVGALPVRDRDGGQRPCRAGDIALLAPTGTELWRYERALEDRSLPVATQAGKGFFWRQEVQDLIGLASALADSRDTLALGAVLRGPLVGMTEEALLDALEALPPCEDGRQPRLHLWLPIAEVGNPLLRETLEILQGLARRARSTTPYVLLAQAVEELRVRPILRRRHSRGAERALANVDAFLEMARGWDTRGLAAFALAMRAQWKDQTRAQEARPDAEQEAVSLITMHAAKGLEWAVVIPINTAGAARTPCPPVLDREAGVLYARIFGFDPPGCADALTVETTQLALERQRLWYVATTRARDLLLLPRMACALPNGAWCAAVPFDLELLPAFDAAGLPPSALPAHDEPPNRQDAAAFTTEASFIVSHMSHIERVTPSRAEAADPEPAPEVLTEAGEEPVVLPRGGRGRGLVLHKLMEEVLSGETEATQAALRARAAVLAETCPEPVTDADADELAATALRTLTLPEIAAVRGSLVAEYPVAASSTSDEGEKIVLGVADAVALSPDGTPDLLVDWKSDVAPAPETIAHYQGQVRAYLHATGARRGLIVFMTAGAVVPVSA